MSRPELDHDIRLVDTTLRDGSHATAHQFTEQQVRDTVHALDRAGVEVIEVTHGDGLGGSLFNYGFSHTDEMTLIAAAREEAVQAKIAVLLVPGIGTVEDLKRARDAGADMVRVATHCTEADVSPQHFAAARDLGMETAGFLMMAHRALPGDLAEQARIMVDAGCQIAYCTDSAGALLMDEARARFEALVAEVGDDAWVGYHGHQNMSLGVANSVIAQEIGVRYIDGSLCALGAGAGNSPTEVLAAVFDRLGVNTGVDVRGLLNAAEDIVHPYMNRWPKMDRNAIVQGWSGVYSSFLLHAVAAAERYKVPAHAILRQCGEIGLVGGQEDMIIDIAIQLAKEAGVSDFFGHVIDGEERESLDGVRFASIDPYTREPWAQVALGGAPEAALAVLAARREFDEGPWPHMGFAERGALIHELADLIGRHADDLAMADTRDMGKPISDAAGKDVPRTAQNFRFFADHARLAMAEVLPMDTGHHAYTRYEPAGVVAAIAPWNFPLMLESWKVAPALAWGNTVVLKPAEDSPASATILARLALEAGIPPGVFNVLHGYGPNSAGAALTSDPRVDRITFTGESGTGRVITGEAAKNLTPVSLELGGKGANLVFADADLDNAINWSIQAIFANAGQVCLAGSRLYVQRPILDEFLQRFVKAAEGLVIGDPKDPATQIGPLASENHYRKVCGYVDNSAGTMLTGGIGDGWVVKPTIVIEAPTDSAIHREEVFGPVVTVTPFDSEAEAVRAANDSPYGLNAMLFTENLSRAHRVAARLRAGTIWTNCFFVRDLRAPFGGFGDSGWGREGGNFSREFFTEPKAVVMAIRDQDAG